MKKIIPLDVNARIVIDSRNYILQYRRNSKSQISWRRGKYFSDLTALCLDYLNASPVREENAIDSIEELIRTITEAEKNILNLISNNKQTYDYEKSRFPKENEQACQR
ncbi:MAG: hypothetical protein ACD_9C00219G0004 [uncultured bacterium]|nr:MAG: hypothetical protein ACD_9C00219G0004 [uncultured bacterium]